MRRFSAVTLVVLGLALTAPGARAQDVSPVSVDPPNVKGLELVEDGFVVHVVFRNNSDRLLVLSDLELELPSSFIAGAREKIVKFNRGAVSVEAHSAQEVEAKVPSVSFKEATKLYFFRSKEYFATLRYIEKDPESGAPQQRTAYVSLKAQSPTLAVCVGGLIGVPLIVLFLLLYDKKYPPQTPSASKPRLWVTILLGWSVVLIAVFVFRFSDTELPQLPIAIQLKDFYGGVLLGMCYEPLARLFAKTREK